MRASKMPKIENRQTQNASMLVRQSGIEPHRAERKSESDLA
jgi:hypothetical protein